MTVAPTAFVWQVLDALPMDGPVAFDTIIDGNPVAFDVVANREPAPATQTPRADVV